MAFLHPRRRTPATMAKAGRRGRRRGRPTAIPLQPWSTRRSTGSPDNLRDEITTSTSDLDSAARRRRRADPAQSSAGAGNQPADLAEKFADLFASLTGRGLKIPVVQPSATTTSSRTTSSCPVRTSGCTVLHGHLARSPEEQRHSFEFGGWFVTSRWSPTNSRCSA